MFELPGFVSFLNWLQGVTLWMFADLKVTGLENVPREGPLIIVSNHQSNIDPALLGKVMPRRIGFLAKREIFSNPLSKIRL